MIEDFETHFSERGPEDAAPSRIVAFFDRHGETIAAVGFLLLIPAIIALASMAEIILLPEATVIAGGE